MSSPRDIARLTVLVFLACALREPLGMLNEPRAKKLATAGLALAVALVAVGAIWAGAAWHVRGLRAAAGSSDVLETWALLLHLGCGFVTVALAGGVLAIVFAVADAVATHLRQREAAHRR